MDLYRTLINSARWRKLRRAVLSAHPLCMRCEREGRITGASEVHHAVPVESARDAEEARRLMFSPANLVPLCHACHVREHREMKSHSKATARARARIGLEDFARCFPAEGTPGGVFSKGEADGKPTDSPFSTRGVFFGPWGISKGLEAPAQEAGNKKTAD